MRARVHASLAGTQTAPRNLGRRGAVQSRTQFFDGCFELEFSPLKGDDQLAHVSSGGAVELG
jgi:hypothetical protein